MATFNLDGFGHNEGVAKTANYTAAATDSGQVLNFTASATLTLPAVAAGTSNVNVVARVGKPGITLTISPNSADKIVGLGTAGSDDKDVVFTNQPAGSFIMLQAANEATTDSAWTVVRVRGTSTREA